MTWADDHGDLPTVLSRTRELMPPVYASILEQLVDEARHDDRVTGLLLTGSLARGDALPGTDIDLRYILGSSGSATFDRGFRDGVLVERTFLDEESARIQCRRTPMHVYAYLDGRVLYDGDGALGRLRAEASRIFVAYRTPEETKIRIVEDLRHPEDKIRIALDAGDLLKAVFCLDTTSWGLIEGLWAANDRPVPPNSSVRPHLGDLWQPEDVPVLFERLFLAEPKERAEVGLTLLGWVRRQLGAGQQPA